MGRRFEGGDAEAEFWGRVEALKASGMTRSEAVREVVVSDPELHAAFLAAVNGGRARVPGEGDGGIGGGAWDSAFNGGGAGAGASSAWPGGAEAEAWRRIAALTGAGVPRSEAVGRVCREDPGLHRAWVSEYNRKHGRRALGRFAG